MKDSSSELIKEFASISHPYLDEIKEKILLFLKCHKTLFRVLEKWPNEVEADLFEYCFKFLISVGKKFTMYRSIRHQLRIICFHYLIRKNLIMRQQSLPTEVDLEFRFLPTYLKFPFTQKSVLGIAICIYLPDRYNHFDYRHILEAAQKILPNAGMLKESFLSLNQAEDPLRLIYLEIEKDDGRSFLHSEILSLKEHFKEELTRHVETTTPPMFGASDVEEAMRGMAALSREVQSDNDIPQLTISFEKIKEESLAFRVILARPVQQKTPSISEYFQKVREDFEYIHDRSSDMGCISSKMAVTREASIFYINIPKHSYFLRSNSSFNFIEARKHVLDILTKAFGEVRDYNGGIFAKQQELFQQFKTEFSELAEKDIECLEDFFHGLNPPEIRAILPLASLSELFRLYLNAKSEKLSKKESVIFKTQIKDSFFFAILRFRHPEVEQEIKRILKKNELTNEFFASLEFKDNKGITLGYIFPDIQIGKKFNQIIQEYLKSWEEQIRNAQILRLTMQNFPISLDPRLGGDVLSGSILKMLFEGLMSIGKNDKPEFAVSKSVSISKDGKQYIFKLRKCYWSNGDLVTAQDFSYSWKKILSPNFNSPFVYLFYIIKNAKKAKKGDISLEKIGVEAIDDFTLQVDLEFPFPSFLERICLPLFSPVNHRIDCLHPNWSLQKGSFYVSNGPFQFTNSHHPEIYELKKNPQYWNQPEMKLNRIHITRASPKQALKMYIEGKNDWLGRPFNEWIPSFSKNSEKHNEQSQSISTHWYIFNTKSFPFQSNKIRQALSLAIDRQAILSLIPHTAIPAFSPLPLHHTKFKVAQRELESDIYNAKKLFEEGLREQEINHNDFPIITISHNNNELNKEIAFLIISQWKEIFNIDCKFENLRSKQLFTKITNKEFQVAGLGWIPVIDDPYYTFDIFKHSEDRINFSNWERKEYINFIEKSLNASDKNKRHEFLFEAERILINEMPVMPIFYEFEPFRKKEYVQEFLLSKFCNIDYKEIFINNLKR